MRQPFAFTVLGEAEAKAQWTTLEQVHFHEVGAVVLSWYRIRSSLP